MISRAVGTVIKVDGWGDEAQEIVVQVSPEETRRALNYLTLTGNAALGDKVLLNTTAEALKLGTGGFDYVIANLHYPEQPSHPGKSRRVFAEVVEGEGINFEAPKANRDFRHKRHFAGHIVKGRYLPCQQTVLTLEEQEEYAKVWGKRLRGLPVVVGQLHSQIAPVAAGLQLSGKAKVVYIMTDQGALPLAFSKLVRDLKAAGLLHMTITCGQAFGGDYETVTLHSALLAAKHILGCDAVIVCQGPGNAGTGTKYGFSGIEQAQNLDIVKALNGTAIAVVRMSSADTRERHRGISHHTRTALDLCYSRCVIGLPTGTDAAALPPGHDVRFVEGTQAALDLLAARGVPVTTMGRTPAEDSAFFLAAAAAGMV